MDEKRFWSLVDASRDPQQDRQEAKLAGLLQKLNPAEIAEFEHVFGAQLRKAYTWDLWAAAYIINGGASDDGFEYFRRWLISRGQSVFDAALKNPDALADLIPRNEQEPADFEMFAAVAGEVWKSKTSIDPWRDLNAGFFADGGSAQPIDEKPAGEPFEEDPAHLAHRLPKLWKRFGDNPLGG